MTDRKARIERFRLRGRATIYSYDDYGGKILVYRSNIITNSGKIRAAELLGGLDAQFISRCQIGDGGTNGVDLNIPIAPEDTDVALVNVLQDEPISLKSVSAGPPPVLNLSTDFFTATPNINPFLTGNEVASEAGLLTQDGILFARITFPSIPFNPPARAGLVVDWEIEIV